MKNTWVNVHKIQANQSNTSVMAESNTKINRLKFDITNLVARAFDIKPYFVVLLNTIKQYRMSIYFY